ncbi:hypothetical protein [Aquicella lusitana]|uniref:PQ loop repeat protein n=1 Tax=Aquicella lusitana TaxID=254246 RepID=A0A370G7J8_9COXI|nr:hypothetical protein [Aquicella lusitana]RDI39056.1 hypothetical protein C8D86_12912 [Aquicella lusitana]VVC73663.1 hypothetical protein AQULUS_14100 [Aquicella lusitana]
MDNIHETLGIIAGILAISGYIPYIISIFLGKTRPNKATWFIWALVGALLAFSYIAEGDIKAIWLPLGYFLGPLITAILSIWYGYTAWSRLDKACIVIAVLSIIPWLLSKDANLTLIINVLIDATGAIPTIVKSHREPDTEDATAWIIFFIANTIQLFAITVWNIAAIYPIYLFLLAGAIVFFILKDKIKKRIWGTQ